MIIRFLVETAKTTATSLSRKKMTRPKNREEALKALRSSISEGKAIVGAGAGIGLSAKFIEQGGGDIIVIYNSGRYRMAGA